MMNHSQRRFAELDLVKRTVEVCMRCEGAKLPGTSGIRTDEKGRERLASLLCQDDVAGREACSIAFLPGRYLRDTAGCTACILNPGKLRMIWKSTRKTDQEDARKIAAFIMRTPREELPLVPSGGTGGSTAESGVDEAGSYPAEVINRLHTISVQAGLKKSALATAAGRKQQRAALTREAHILIAGSIGKERGTPEEEPGGIQRKARRHSQHE
jgi:hypothetical protein